jgi:hypothetical protein
MQNQKNQYSHCKKFRYENKLLGLYSNNMFNKKGISAKLRQEKELPV